MKGLIENTIFPMIRVGNFLMVVYGTPKKLLGGSRILGIRMNGPGLTASQGGILLKEMIFVASLP